MKYTIRPTLRRDKMNKDGLCPVAVFVYQSGKLIKKVAVGHAVRPDDWNEDLRRVNPKTPKATLINSIIVQEVAKLDAAALAGVASGVDTFKEAVRKEAAKDVNYYAFAEQQVKQKNYADETRRLYSTFIEKMKAFRPAVRLADINFLFLQGYEAYLRDRLKNDHNTIWNNIKFIRTILSDAKKAGLIQEKDDPFKTYVRPKYRKTKPTFLDAPELSRVAAFADETDVPEFEQTARFFLFMAYSGLRYSDAIRFRKSEHVVNDERIYMNTQKFKRVANILIHDRLRPLIDYIDANPVKVTSVEFNRRLKIVAGLCKIKKKLSSHVGRHTFGSLLVDLGVSMDVAKELLSHGSTASTKIYYHVKQTNADEAAARFNKL